MAWGVRFGEEEDAYRFLDGLAGELESRLKAAGVKGRCITLKLLRRREVRCDAVGPAAGLSWVEWAVLRVGRP